MNFLTRLRSGSEGSEIAESALVLPLVFTLLMAIIWFGRGYNVYTTITFAAREAAQAYVQQGCATCATSPPDAATAATRVAQVLQASHIDPTQIQSYTPSPAPAVGNCSGSSSSSSSSQVTVYKNVQLNPGSSGPAACGVVVSFQYPFRLFSVPFTSLGQSNVILKADAQMQAEN